MQSRILHRGNMDDTTSEATSPYSASRMDSSSMYNQSNSTYQFHSQQQMTHSQATQDRFLQGEASQQPRAGFLEDKMNEDVKKARKRQADKKYRQKRKAELAEMTSQNQHLQDKNRELSTENRQLKEEKESLINKNTQLEEQIRGLQGKGQLPVEVMQRHDSYISHPASQVDQNVHVQDHEMEVNNDDHVYNNNVCPDNCHNAGAIDALDGFALDELLHLLPPDDEMTTNVRIALNEPTTEHPESSQSDLYPARVAKIKLQKFLTDLDAEVPSNVDPLDFRGLEGEQKRLGRFSFPSSLIPTVERIKNAYGDISATCLISPSVSGTSYVLFCAVIRDMEHLQLDQVTEDIMVKWRDVIKDALGLGFNVAFAMEHLKKVACAYFGQSGYTLLNDIDSKISTLEAEVNDWKKKRAEIYEESKMSIDAVENFIGVPISTDNSHLMERIVDFKTMCEQMNSDQASRQMILVNQ
ncbi:hypothetical protein J1N35_003991 [Gossypium stocksii]|uniref:BZIP domain-containing protein n=1 Tax=Gossypium stocksii TaxID=47602 RepID=A0A9D4AHX5_9ROSI|nr:hypothetical protein J1N35_003991 [Gossypium stocksii]